jgi:hypothetical protein
MLEISSKLARMCIAALVVLAISIADGGSLYLAALLAGGIESAQADPRGYSIVLDALGRSSEISAQSLDDLETLLTRTGSTRGEAQAAILTVIRNVDTKAAMAGEIVMLARDIGAVMGTGMVVETGRLVATITGGYDGMVRYGFAHNALSADDAAAMRHGENLLLDRLKRSFAGKYEELRRATLTDAQRAAERADDLRRAALIDAQRAEELRRAALTDSQRAEECNSHAEENKREFDLALHALRSKSPTAAAETQQGVANLCMSGMSEREAFNAQMAILRGR